MLQKLSNFHDSLHWASIFEYRLLTRLALCLTRIWLHLQIQGGSFVATLGHQSTSCPSHLEKGHVSASFPCTAHEAAWNLPGTSLSSLSRVRSFQTCDGASFLAPNLAKNWLRWPLLSTGSFEMLFGLAASRNGGSLCLLEEISLTPCCWKVVLKSEGKSGKVLPYPG